MTHRDRLKKAIDDMHSTTRCMEIFDEALAEKDLQCRLMDDELHLLLHLLRQKHQDHQKLTAQAVRFARGYEECYCPENVASTDVCLFHEAQAFLKEHQS